MGPFASPIFWNADEAGEISITKEMVMQKRVEIFALLNDEDSNTPCKCCNMVIEKEFSEVDFSKLGHIDVAACTICNLRCNFCGYVTHNLLKESKYEPLNILKLFSPEDVIWSSAVDFNGGEPTLLKNFNEYMEYFNDRKIRIFLYTNAVTYKQAVYDGLVNGSIGWVCTSLDAGTHSTFFKSKERDKFNDVIETLTRYAHAGSQNGGQMAVKYIFTEDNCSEDDVTGFVYAMLAIRPQQIWLTFDFNPILGIPGDSEDFGGYDYSKHIEAYVKTYMMLKKHGMDAGHFTENHLAAIGNHGKMLMKAVYEKIAAEEKTVEVTPELLLDNFRALSYSTEVDFNYFNMKSFNEPEHELSSPDKTAMVVPVCHQSIELLKQSELKKVNVVGIVDRTKSLHGKGIEGTTVYGYDAISKLEPDVVLVSCAERIEKDVLRCVAGIKNKSTKIYLYDRGECK